MYNLTNWLQLPLFFFFPFSLSRSLVRSFVHSLTRSFVLSNSMILDKLRHKIIIELNSLCPAVSHLMIETSQNDFFFLSLPNVFFFVCIYICVKSFQAEFFRMIINDGH